MCGGFDRSLLSADAPYLKCSKGAQNAWACCMTESECSRSSTHTFSDIDTRTDCQRHGGSKSYSLVHLLYFSLSVLKAYRWKGEWRGVRQSSGSVFVMSFVQEAFSGLDMVGDFEEAQRSSNSRRPGRWKGNTDCGSGKPTRMGMKCLLKYFLSDLLLCKDPPASPKDGVQRPGRRFNACSVFYLRLWIYLDLVSILV